MNGPTSRDRRLHWIVFAASAAAGAFVWIASPWLTGHREPWDAEGYFYLSWLAGVGFVAGIAAPRAWWVAAVGLYVGQFVGTLTSGPIGSLAPLGWLLVLPLASSVTLASAGAGTLIHWLAATAWTFCKTISSKPEPRA